MAEKNTYKDQRRNAGQMAPMQGSKKVKQRNHSRQNHGEGH